MIRSLRVASVVVLWGATASTPGGAQEGAQALDAPRPALVRLTEGSATLGTLHELRDELTRSGLCVTGLVPPRTLLARLDANVARFLAGDARVEAVLTEAWSSARNDRLDPRTLDLWRRLHAEPESSSRAVSAVQVRMSQAACRCSTSGAPGPGPQAVQGSEDAGGPALTPRPTSVNDTSLFMAGEIAVGVFFLDGTNGAWTQPAIDAYFGEIVAACEVFPDIEPKAGIQFTYVNEGVVNEGVTPLPDDWRQYANDLREAYSTDWAFMIQVENSFRTARATLLGPETQVYANSNRDVIRHEVGHIFGTLDQYPAGSPPTSSSGYLGVVNANGMRNTGEGFFGGRGEGVDDFMISPSSFEVFTYSRGQLGWRDADGDGVLDPLDTFPETTLAEPQGDSVVSVSGEAHDRPLPNAFPFAGFGDVSIHGIDAVAYRINGLTWIDVEAQDGSFGDRSESFLITTPELPDGDYVIEARALNAVGNVEAAPARATVSVVGSTVANLAPFAAFDVTPARGSVFTAFTLDAGASRDLEDAASLEFRWDLDGDGAWDTPWSTHSVVTGVSLPAGTRTVALQVRDSTQTVASLSRAIEVSAFDQPPHAAFSVSPDSFHGSPDPSTPYYEVTLDPSASFDPEHPVFVRWDFENDGIWDTSLGPPLPTTHAVALDFGPPNVARVELDAFGGLAVEALDTPHAVVSGTFGVRVFDVTDPTSPILVGSESTAVSGRGLARQGSVLFVADGTAGVVVLDVSDPSVPAVIGTHPATAFEVDVVGTVLVAAGAGVSVLDVADPANPTLLGSIDLPGNEDEVVLAGSTAYVGAGGSGLHLVDVTNPAGPGLLGTFSGGGELHDLAVHGDVVYGAFGDAGLRLVDVSSPAAPAALGTVDIGGEALSVCLKDTEVWVGDDAFGVERVDVSNPLAPRSLARADVRGTQGRGLATSGSTLLVASLAGLELVDLGGTPVAHSRSIARTVRLQVQDAVNGVGRETTRDVWGVTYNHPPSVDAFAWEASATARVPGLEGSFPLEVATTLLPAGNLLYVADGSQGVRIVDVSQVDAPTEVGFYPLAGAAQGLCLDGHRLFVVERFYGLRILDVSNPRAPVEMGSLATSELTWDVEVAGTTAYLTGLSGLLTVDVSDPAQPVVLGGLSDIGFQLDVEIVGGLAYLASISYGLRIVDVGDPAQPVVLGALELGEGRSVAVRGDHVFLAAGSLGLLAVDVSSPAKPRLAGVFDTPDTSFHAVVDGDYAYVADNETGMLVVDVRQPAFPRSAGRWTGPDSVLALAVESGRIFASERLQGVVTLATTPAQEHRWRLSGFTDPDFDTSWDGQLEFRIDMGDDGTWDTAFTPYDEAARALYVIAPGEPSIVARVEVRDRFGALASLVSTFPVRQELRDRLLPVPE